MNILWKIFLWILSAFIFLYLVLVTYISSSSSYFENINFKDIQIWKYSLEESSNGFFSVNKLLENWTGGIIIEQIWVSDKTIYSSGSITLTQNGNNKTIQVEPWLYFFDLRELGTNYIISWKGFKIQNKWPGLFFVNSLDEKKNIIFSLNSILYLDLISLKDNTKSASIDLFPHTYLIFNPTKNIFVNNADLLKITQVFDLEYFDGQVIINEEVSEEIINLISLKDDKTADFVQKTLSYIDQEHLKNKEIVNRFLVSTFGLLPWEDLIDKYFPLLINDSKKDLYYKNIVIRSLHKLLTSDSVSPETISKIVENYILLKNINPGEAEQMKKIIDYYYSSIIKSNQSTTISMNYFELINRLNNTSAQISFKSLIELQKLFFYYDYFWKANFYQNIVEFKADYLHDLNIDLEWSDPSKWDIDDIEKADYLMFFLENIILSSTFSSKDAEWWYLITIFNDYVTIANRFYSKWDATIKRTWIFTSSKLLNKFISILETNFFEEERNRDNLLVIKSWVTYDEADMKKLENNIGKIYLFFETFKNVLNENESNKDKFTVLLYGKLEKKFGEYFDALKDYKDYLVRYDQSKIDLLAEKSIQENENTIMVSSKNAQDYLKTFNGVNFNYTTIKVMDYNYCADPVEENEDIAVEFPYCYKITDLNVGGNNVSFLLHPFQKNTMDEIVVEWEKKSGSYKLDDIEAILEEKMKMETKNQDKYDFKNYLVSTFWQQVIVKDNTVVQEEEVIQIEEDPVIKIFKRNKLFWDAWDFSVLEWILDMEYFDVIVEKESDSQEYKININNGTFQINLWKAREFYGTFASSYNFSPKHSFINPEFKVIDKKSKRDLLLWNSIYTLWELKVTEVQEGLIDIFENYTYINFVVNSIYENLDQKLIRIEYNQSKNVVILETLINSQKLVINMKAWDVTNIELWWRTLIQNSIQYTSIGNILNGIK